ncbi:MAG: DNRLRE domain-containing protein, partial [Myxococcota bacterium]
HPYLTYPWPESSPPTQPRTKGLRRSAIRGILQAIVAATRVLGAAAHTMRLQMHIQHRPYAILNLSSAMGIAIAIVALLCVPIACGIPMGPVASPLEDPSPPRPLMARRANVAARDMLLVMADKAGGAVGGVASLSHKPLGQFPVHLVGSDGEQTRWHGYLHFSLQAVPQHAHIDSAHLVLTTDGNRGTNPDGLLTIAVVAEPWDSTSLSWANQPQLHDTWSIEAQVEHNHTLRLDISPVVRAWTTGRTANHGLALLPARPQEPFWTSYRGTTPNISETHQPRLEIRYTWSPPTDESVEGVTWPR